MYQTAPPLQRNGIKRHPLDRLRFQIPLTLVLSVALPALVAAVVLSVDALQTLNTELSLAASAAAALGALWMTRSFNSVPGATQGTVHIFMLGLCFAIVFGLVAAFRLDFSRVILFSGLTFTVMGAIPEIARRTEISRGHFWVVPFGSVDRLYSIVGANWKNMDRPSLPTRTQLGIVADLRYDLPDDWERMLASAALAGIPVYHVKQLEEGITGKVDIEHLSENTLGSLVPNRAYATVKRMIDMAGAIVLLPFLLPLFAIVGLLIKLDSRGPVFFIQDRTGQRAEPFRVIKFRTMTHQDEASSDENADDKRVASITQDGDARVTRLGRFLRRSRIDELPQIINVLRGEMSWIGPRPEAISLSDWYRNNLPFYDYRHIVKPGITGWAQVNQGHVAELDEVHDKLRYDFFYIKNFSATLDLVIVARTLRVMIGGFGSR